MKPDPRSKRCLQYLRILVWIEVVLLVLVWFEQVL